MRFVRFSSPDGPRAGVLRDGRVFGTGEETILPLLAGEVEAGDDDGVPVEEVSLLPPIGRPGKLICIGLNYRAHAEEQGLDPPETPTFFGKFPNALAAPGAVVELPPWSSKVDYEAEVAFAIGSRCKEVAAADALGVVAGYTLLNDLSARDYQFKTPQWMPGKTFDGAAPCGPALVTPDEAGPPDAIEIELVLNGETMQASSTDDLVHSIPELIEYLSMLMTLEPGDLVATGTPAGVGSSRDPKVWLTPGDEVEVRSPQLGVLKTVLA
jgi:2-keto-4-pentenoate hydratase/2-oxohepta-3-ene-1,7-dioic acid hydratase in catechol pathway